MSRKTSDNFNKCCLKNNNTGFTLVELIVVLVLMMILLSLVIFGGLSWQDWTRFKHENTVAEDIFYAAQNQITEWDAGNTLDRKVKVLKGNGFNSSNPYVLAYSKMENGTMMVNSDIVNSIKNNEGENYSWDTIWGRINATSGAINGGSNGNLEKEERTLLRIKAKQGDYSKYLQYKTDSNSVVLDAGTILLFDMVSQYIADTSVLNGSIVLEFSPEAGQVFSVCYSDRVSEFYYNSEGAAGIDLSKATSVMDRREDVRRDLMFGYYSVERLAERLKGKTEESTDLILEIRNGELLEFVIHNKSGVAFSDDDTLQFTVYDGDNPEAPEDAAMKFSIRYGDISNGGYDVACQNAVIATDVEILKGKLKEANKDILKFRFPAWKESDSVFPGKEEIHIVLDAADVQAESASYSKLYNASITGETTSLPTFCNTFSFYRFGLAGEVSNIHANISLKGAQSTPAKKYMNKTSEQYPDGFFAYVDDTEAIESSGVIGESVAFASAKKSNTEMTYELKNGRHLFNIRYETEFKKDDSPNNIFKLVENIDWNQFVGKENSGDKNYFLNSFDTSQQVDTRVVAGINYPGYSKATGGTGDSSAIETDTKNMPFPGFRCLGKNDVFTQQNAYDEENPSAAFVISNLKISFMANVVYGVYEDVFKEANEGIKDKDNNQLYQKAFPNTLASSAFWNDDFSSLLGLYFTNLVDINQHVDSSRSNLARGGALPLGLFAENLGTISNITLDKHVVSGLEKNGTDTKLVYTCMVGGFVGNNLNTLENLTLLNSDNSTTHISGRTDVGGIAGRQSFSLAGKEDVAITGMKNYGKVSGMENVGGIIGRAYVHYVGDTNTATKPKYYDSNRKEIKEEKNLRKYAMYHDGYYISDSYKSMTGAKVVRTNTVTVKDCTNRGMVSGDELLTGTNTIDTVALANNEASPKVEFYNPQDSNSHCAFIGGIIGNAMDGLIIDDGDYTQNGQGTTNQKNPLYSYGFGINATSGTSKVILENCSSYIKYQESDIKNSNFRSYLKDYYVGGIVGYSRLVTIKGCDIAPTGEYGSANRSNCYVLGARYVGGIVGCSDATRYIAGDKAQKDSQTDKTYAAINYNHVIGKVLVGGITGAFGIGDTVQESLSFRDPSGNEGGLPSRYKQKKGKERIAESLKNTGVVLTLAAGADAPEFGVDLNKTSSTGVCGGIAGATRHTISNCDSIQTESTKAYFKGLVGMDVDGNVSNIVFGGNYVGGIIGYQMISGHVNPGGTVSNTKSYIDAVVYGNNQVGGGVGYAFNDSIGNNYVPYKAGNNSTGMSVYGKDYVGGICGHCNERMICYFSNVKVENGYSVSGRIGVGGLYGRLQNVKQKGQNVETNADYDESSWQSAVTIGQDDSNNKTHVDGNIYVGGFVGIVDSPAIANITGVTIKNMEIKGDYFAGGQVGVITNDLCLTTIMGKATINNTVDVKAAMFAGGVAGLYLNGTGEDYTPGDTLLKIAEECLGKDINAVYNGLFKNDIVNNNPFPEYTNKTILSIGSSKSSANVAADLFAGGLFGYVPNNRFVSIEGYTNKNNVVTKSYVVGSFESYDSTVKYSYLGAVTGRVSKNMVLVRCKNAAVSYAAEKADYIGALAEVNTGTICGTKNGDNEYLTDETKIVYCSNSKCYDSSQKGVGGFVGVNGTKYGIGTIQFCENTATITTSSDKDVVAGIAAAIGGESHIQYCKNTGKITTSKDGSKAGGIAGTVLTGLPNSGDENLTGKVEIVGCINLGTVTAGPKVNTGEENPKTGYAAGIVCDTNGLGDIEYCRNYGPITATTDAFAITAKEATVVRANLEAGGMHAPEAGEDAKTAGYPIAPISSMEGAVYVRNFYIYGTLDPEPVSGTEEPDPGTGDEGGNGGEQNPGTDNESGEGAGGESGEGNTDSQVGEEGDNQTPDSVQKDDASPAGDSKKDGDSDGDQNDPENVEPQASEELQAPEGDADGEKDENTKTGDSQEGEAPIEVDAWPKKLMVQPVGKDNDSFYLRWEKSGTLVVLDDSLKEKIAFNQNPAKVKGATKVYDLIDLDMIAFLRNETDFPNNQFVGE